MMVKVNPGGKKEDNEEMEEENCTTNISAEESTDLLETTKNEVSVGLQDTNDKINETDKDITLKLEEWGKHKRIDKKSQVKKEVKIRETLQIKKEF